MKRSISTAIDILYADTDDLIELAEMAGSDPYLFYEGANFREADLTSEDLSMLSLVGAKIDGSIYTPQTEARIYLKANSHHSPFDFKRPWMDQFKEKVGLMSSSEDGSPFSEFERLMEMTRYSLSLSPLEKYRVLDAAWSLSPFQISELTKVFDEEVVKFRELADDHSLDIAKLVVKVTPDESEIEGILDRIFVQDDASKTATETDVVIDVKSHIDGLDRDQMLTIIEFQTPRNDPGSKQYRKELSYNSVLFRYNISTLIEQNFPNDSPVYVQVLDKCISVLGETERKVLIDYANTLIWFLRTLDVLKLNDQHIGRLEGALIKLFGTAFETLEYSEFQRILREYSQKETTLGLGDLTRAKILYFAAYSMSRFGQSQEGIALFSRLEALVASSEKEEDYFAEFLAEAQANTIELLLNLGMYSEAKIKITDLLGKLDEVSTSILPLQFFEWVTDLNNTDCKFLIDKCSELDDALFGWSFKDFEQGLSLLPKRKEDAARSFIIAYDNRKAERGSDK